VFNLLFLEPVCNFKLEGPKSILTVVSLATDNLPQVISFVLGIWAQGPRVKQFLSLFESLFGNSKGKATCLAMEVDECSDSVLVIL